MWGRMENRKELLCQYLRTGQLFKSGPATSLEYVWYSEMKEVDETELQFCRVFFSVWIQDLKSQTFYNMKLRYSNVWDK